MAGESTPQDAIAEIAKLIGEPRPASADNHGDQQADGGDNELAEFQDNPTDAPEIVALKKQLRGTMTRRTQAIAEERRRIAEQSKAAEQDRRDAELFRALKTAQDPQAAAKALIGNSHSPNGIIDPDAVLTKHKTTFDEPTYNGIVELARAVWRQEAQQNLTPYQQAIQTLFSERTEGEKSKVVAEYGDDANRWMDSARDIQSKNPGLSLKQALLLASEGQVSFGKLRSVVADARKRAVTQTSVSEQSVGKKIGLTREERKAQLADQIRDLAERSGNPDFARFARR